MVNIQCVLNISYILQVFLKQQRPFCLLPPHTPTNLGILFAIKHNSNLAAIS